MQSGPTTRGFRLSMNMLKKARYALPTAAAGGKDRLRPHAQPHMTSAPRSARASPPSAVIDYPPIKTLSAPNRTRKNGARRDRLNYCAVPVTNLPVEATMSATINSPSRVCWLHRCDGVALSYEQQGEGIPSSSFMADFYPVPCGRRCCLILPMVFRAITPDSCGHGRSTNPTG